MAWHGEVGSGVNEPKHSFELEQLTRVYNRLSNFASKVKLLRKLEIIEKRLAKIALHKARPEISVLDSDGLSMDTVKIDTEDAEKRVQKQAIQKELEQIASRPTKISVADLNAAMRRLGEKRTKAELKHMIWEVDENLDGCIDWEEFKLMHHRHMTDKTGLEPCRFYNVVQFMMYDKDYSGKVCIDETMTMLYQRYGKHRLHEELQKLFGEDLKTQDGDSLLTFQEYLKVVNLRLVGVNRRPPTRHS